MNETQEQLVAITRAELKELEDSAFKLHCLEQGGVDNWEWYGESLRDGGYFKDDEESD